ncbi:MAG: 4-hydroxy-3-methylbut-2-enyl diphosphate reductase [Bacteroidia bacterium]|nr:4-hydroxy-3-methylbut-2-enyl diphosphate reductase [Bacteroidia bacterium]MDW8301939.1 4-hydroxy-3-methylbut-2-enyl diphosphate reductase [Bacteroidia bacterium]
MEVTIDQNSGFCFGVLYAIQMAEDELAEKGTLYCLGDIVHNNKEIERLTAKGLKIINHEDLKQLKNTTVLIRAHGEPPETYKIAIENNLTLIDASCPVVLKLQHRVKTAFDLGTQIVIYGEPGHAEVNGLLGQTKNQAIVIRNIQELDKIDFSRPITLFSQTTKSTKEFYEIAQEIQKRQAEFKANDTICRQVSNRDVQLREFAKKFDVIIFVSGKKSSNGKVLYKVCQSVNPRSYFISDVDELMPEWFENCQTVGVCGATSTPMWLMEQVAEAIRNQTFAVAKV